MITVRVSASHRGTDGIVYAYVDVQLPAVLPLQSWIVLPTPEDWEDIDICVEWYLFRERTLFVYGESENRFDYTDMTTDELRQSLEPIGWVCEKVQKKA